MKHHPLQALEHALDHFDDEMDSLRKDVRDGIHDAVFDEESLLHPVGGARCRDCGAPGYIHHMPGDRPDFWLCQDCDD